MESVCFFILLSLSLSPLIYIIFACNLLGIFFLKKRGKTNFPFFLFRKISVGIFFGGNFFWVLFATASAAGCECVKRRSISMVVGECNAVGGVDVVRG